MVSGGKLELLLGGADGPPIFPVHFQAGSCAPQMVQIAQIWRPKPKDNLRHLWMILQ
jgi:hypothetical protein